MKPTHFTLHKVKELEKFKRIHGQISDFNNLIISQKHEYNELLSANTKTEEKVEHLERVLREWTLEKEETCSLNENYQKRRKQHSESLMRLRRESFCQRSLSFMKNSRIQDLARIQKPTNLLSRELQVLTAQSQESRTMHERLQQQIKQLKKESAEFKKAYTAEQNEWNSNINGLLRIYEDQKCLKYYMNFEFVRNWQLKSQENKAKHMLAIEQRISDLKEDNLIYEESIKVERYHEAQEEKFKDIQKNINVTSIEDVVPHHNYLLETQGLLKNTIGDYKAEIDQLLNRKKQLQNEISDLQLKAKDVYLPDILEIERLENSLQLKSKSKDETKEETKKLDDLNASVNNAFSRIYSQLKEDEDEDMDKNRQLNFRIAYCFLKLEKMMDYLQSQRKPYSLESVNTNMNYSHVPAFLNLNTAGFITINEEDTESLLNLDEEENQSKPKRNKS